MNDRLDKLAKIHYGKSPNGVASIDGDVPIVGTGGIYGLADRAMFERGIVVARKGSLGTPHVFKKPFWPVDTTYAVVPRDGVDLDWLYYCLLNFDLTKLNEATGVPSINRDWLSRTSFANPGTAKQAKIATILLGIDTAIEKTEALIAKYQQIKTGLMYDLFTRGMLPNGQLRPPREQAPELYQETSIGWIPKHWDVIPVERCCSAIVDCPHSTPYYETSGIPCIRTADMVPGELLLEQAYRVSEKAYRTRVERLVPRAGDIIYSREGERLGIASPVGIEPVCLGQRVMLLRPEHAESRSFLMWVMNMPLFYRQVLKGLGATTSPHVNVGDIKNLLVPSPSLDEQLQIGSTITGASKKLRIETLAKEKLLQQKLGMMQDLLTGKVSVKVGAGGTAHG